MSSSFGSSFSGLRSFVALSALAASAAFVRPALAAAPTELVYDAVNAYQVNASNDSEITHRSFAVTGILHGQSAEQTATYQFYYDQVTPDRLAPSCERYALMAMKSAGHFALVLVVGEIDPVTVTACRLQRL
jgi:hypothetical protein